VSDRDHPMPSVTLDLVPPAAPLVPIFPLAGPIRPLTLYPGADDEVRVHWRLRADEIVGHGACFPRSDGAPQAVLRLGRVNAGSGSEQVRTQTLHLSGLSGSGEVAFQVGKGPGLFEAELGLVNPEGGWLLLARSNRLQQVPGLGLESLRPPPPGLDWDCVAGLGPEGQGEPGERAGECHRPPDDSGVTSGASQADPERAAPPVTTLMHPIPSLNYADPTPATIGLVITAELHLQGWSTPNTVIDLFGHRYRVGAGGRFQLSVRVDDPELIRRALAQHPPLESDDPR